MRYPGVSSLNPFDDRRARWGFVPVLARFVLLGKEKRHYGKSDTSAITWLRSVILRSGATLY